MKTVSNAMEGIQEKSLNNSATSSAIYQMPQSTTECKIKQFKTTLRATQPTALHRSLFGHHLQPAGLNLPSAPCSGVPVHTDTTHPARRRRNQPPKGYDIALLLLLLAGLHKTPLHLIIFAGPPEQTTRPTRQE